MPVQNIVEDPHPSIPRKLDKPKLLLGEGKDEERFLSSLVDHLGVNDVLVEAYEGKTNLGPYLKTLRKRPGFSDLISIGITRDANGDARAAFDSLCGHLQRNQFAVPSTCRTIERGTPNVGVMILPDEDTPGTLEDLCLKALSLDPLMKCLDEYFRCINTVSASPKELSKARIHAWLSAQNPPDLRLGIAAQKGLLDWSKAEFGPLKTFVGSL